LRRLRGYEPGLRLKRRQRESAVHDTDRIDQGRRPAARSVAAPAPTACARHVLRVGIAAAVLAAGIALAPLARADNAPAATPAPASDPVVAQRPPETEPAQGFAP
jgi:hypothetical protein